MKLDTKHKKVLKRKRTLKKRVACHGRKDHCSTHGGAKKQVKLKVEIVSVKPKKETKTWFDSLTGWVKTALKNITRYFKKDEIAE